ncbi:MAG: rhodanese-like domain-containing protein [Candidatus Heimdallarchaeota archaeon]|nr:MAG: rhodanese-like domain-containing protein [Candidatus Heimdallarchaeota archaeon]
MNLKKVMIKTSFLFLTLLFVTNFLQVTSSSFEDITPEEAKRRIDLDPTIFILDVRSSIEFRDGHISGAININVYYINSYAYLLPDENETGIIVYCDNGIRSKKGAEKVVNLGYTNVSNMLEGYFGWLELGYPYVTGTETSLITPTTNIGLVSIICISVIVLIIWNVKLSIKSKRV